MSTLEVVAPDGLGEVTEGMDLIAAIADLLAGVGGLVEGDLVVITSKIISKHEGRLVQGTDRAAAVAEEEAALLGVPTLVHRKETERGDGLGENAELSGWDVDVLHQFLRAFAERRRPPQTLRTSPSDIVVKDLMTRAYH